MSPCSNYLVTGSYNKSVHVTDVGFNYNSTIEAKFDLRRGKPIGKVRSYGSNKKLGPLEGQSSIDFKKKIMQGTWNPKDNTLAIAFRNCIFLYSDKT